MCVCVCVCVCIYIYIYLFIPYVEHSSWYLHLETTGFPRNGPRRNSPKENPILWRTRIGFSSGELLREPFFLGNQWSQDEDTRSCVQRMVWINIIYIYINYRIKLSNSTQYHKAEFYYIQWDKSLSNTREFHMGPQKRTHILQLDNSKSDYQQECRTLKKTQNHNGKKRRNFCNSTREVTLIASW